MTGWSLQENNWMLDYQPTFNLVPPSGERAEGRLPKDEAEFALRACNAHDELVAACERAENVLAGFRPLADEFSKTDLALKAIRAALAKVESPNAMICRACKGNAIELTGTPIAGFEVCGTCRDKLGLNGCGNPPTKGGAQ